MKSRGYLTKDFMYFHLVDSNDIRFEAHFHDFNKIILLKSGKVTYFIEGKAYMLQKNDIIFVGQNELHRPVVEPGCEYDRIIIWVNSYFLKEHSIGKDDLGNIFKDHKGKSNLLRLDEEKVNQINDILGNLEEEYKQTRFGTREIKTALILQLLVHLNRFNLGSAFQTSGITNKFVEEVIGFIEENLEKELTIDEIAGKFFLNKYHLMHKFKKSTGYSLHNFILQKRLVRAKNMLEMGMAAGDAAVKSGFKDYSNFVRAYKKAYGISPSRYVNRNKFS